jgi:Histidine phosphatase superfamily (branch 1)
MPPPAVTRRRRPFLAPLWLLPVAAIVLLLFGWALYHSMTITVVLLVQPMEKDPGTIEDPPVSPEGEERAQRLAHMFGAAAGPGRIEAIYESNERRAEQTGAPLAEQLHQRPVVFNAADAPAAAERAVREHVGGTVLIIASGQHVLEIIQALARIAPAQLAPADPGALYVVSVPWLGQAHLVRFRY